jgi:hypothetical protein
METQLKEAHLNHDQFARMLAGEYQVSEQLHVRNCEACQQSLEELKGVLRGFAADARRGAERPSLEWARQRNAITGRVRKWNAGAPARAWALTCMALLTLAGVLALAGSPHFMPSKASTMITQNPGAGDASVTDEDALLSQVAADLRRDTPEALAPAALLLEERAQILSGPSPTVPRKQVGKGASND